MKKLVIKNGGKGSSPCDLPDFNKDRDVGIDNLLIFGEEVDGNCETCVVRKVNIEDLKQKLDCTTYPVINDSEVADNCNDFKLNLFYQNGDCPEYRQLPLSKLVELMVDCGLVNITISDDDTWIINGEDTGKPSRGVKGDTGARGVKGDTGARGEKGDTGARGEKGDTGARGEKGDTGARGEKGDTGARGEKGDTGAPGVCPDCDGNPVDPNPGGGTGSDSGGTSCEDDCYGGGFSFSTGGANAGATVWDDTGTTISDEFETSTTLSGLSLGVAISTPTKRYTNTILSNISGTFTTEGGTVRPLSISNNNTLDSGGSFDVSLPGAILNAGDAYYEVSSEIFERVTSIEFDGEFCASCLKGDCQGGVFGFNVYNSTVMSDGWDDATETLGISGAMGTNEYIVTTSHSAMDNVRVEGLLCTMYLADGSVVSGSVNNAITTTGGTMTFGGWDSDGTNLTYNGVVVTQIRASGDYCAIG